MPDKLGPLIRWIIIEKLREIIAGKGNIFYFESDVPLYQDMENLLHKKPEGKIELYSDEEVWNERIND